MSIKKTMVIGILGLCSLSAIILSVIIVFINKSNTNRLNENFREYDITSHENQLSSYVDMAYSTIEKNYKNATSKSGLIDEYGGELTRIVEIANNIVKTEYENTQSGKTKLEDAQKNALESLRAISFNNNTEYIFVTKDTSTDPKMLLNAAAPDLEGTLLSGDYFNSEIGTGRNINEVFKELLDENGSGYVYYEWPKTDEDGNTEKAPKLSYAVYFEEWEWTIGTGIFVDEAIKNAKEKSMQELRKMSYDDGNGYFWINDTSTPVTMLMHAEMPELEGQKMDDEKYNVVGDEGKNLFTAFINATDNKENSGFVEYEWPKTLEDGTTKPTAKLSHVKIFKEWNWVIGTGVYLDDVEAAIAEQEKTMAKNNVKFIQYILITIALIIGIAIVLVYRFLSNKIVNPINEIIKYLSEIAKGNLKLHFNESNKKDVLEFSLIKKHLQNTVAELSAVISKINKEAVSVYQSSNETKQYVEELQTNLDNISITTEELSACMEETAAATEEMNVLTEEIETSTSSMVDNINNKRVRLMENATDFKDSSDKLVESLQHMVKGISEVSTANNQNAIGTTEISKSVTDILKQAQNVNKQSDKLKKTAFQLMESVGIFTT
jgi:methyl-accepting chemotaxis protein